MKSRTLFRVATRNRQLHYWYFAIFYLLNKLHIHVFHYYLLLMLLHKTLLAIISRACNMQTLRCVNPIITCEKTVHAVFIWMLNNIEVVCPYTLTQIIDTQAHSINEFWPALISIEYRWVVTTLIRSIRESSRETIFWLWLLFWMAWNWLDYRRWWLTLIMWQFSIQSIQKLVIVGS